MRRWRMKMKLGRTGRRCWSLSPNCHRCYAGRENFQGCSGRSHWTTGCMCVCQWRRGMTTETEQNTKNMGEIIQMIKTKTNQLNQQKVMKKKKQLKTRWNGHKCWNQQKLQDWVLLHLFCENGMCSQLGGLVQSCSGVWNAFTHILMKGWDWCWTSVFHLVSNVLRCSRSG